ncbi:MAG TPA: hypothetical protein PK760_10740, partial [Flavobacteriales bacterium]|nr:hypothetical protein [Flavobacteriales bacterium]
ADNLPWPTAPNTVLQLNSSVTGLDNSAATVDRFWQIDATGTPTASYTFTYLASELPAAPYNVPASMVGQWYDTPANTWNQPLPSQTASAYTVTVPGATQLGPWTLAPTTSLLPIELLGFTAERNGGLVELEWSTASELNSDHFTIYRSADALDWMELGRVPAARNSQHVIDYADVDRKPLVGLNYYKLRQTDTDGQWTESHLVVVAMGSTGDHFGKPYPMPANDKVMMTMPDNAAVIGAEVIDGTGRLVVSLPVTSAGSLLTLNTEAIPVGTYVLTIRTERGSEAWPLLIAR